MAGPILGIDFGTTNTAACFFDKAGKLRLVPTAQPPQKSFILPSVVWYPNNAQALVGRLRTPMPNQSESADDSVEKAHERRP